MPERVATATCVSGGGGEKPQIRRWPSRGLAEGNEGCGAKALGDAIKEGSCVRVELDRVTGAKERCRTDWDGQRGPVHGGVVSK